MFPRCAQVAAVEEDEVGYGTHLLDVCGGEQVAAAYHHAGRLFHRRQGFGGRNVLLVNAVAGQMQDAPFIAEQIEKDLPGLVLDVQAGRNAGALELGGNGAGFLDGTFQRAQEPGPFAQLRVAHDQGLEVVRPPYVQAELSSGELADQAAAYGQRLAAVTFVIGGPVAQQLPGVGGGGLVEDELGAAAVGGEIFSQLGTSSSKRARPTCSWSTVLPIRLSVKRSMSLKGIAL